MQWQGSFIAITTLLSILAAPNTSGVVVGQTDTFEDGTTAGWVVALLGSPHPHPPSNVSSGGPAGTDDNYLLLQSVGGSGPGSRLSVINPSQWAGNYEAAGIRAIRMDVANFGTTDLSLRLLFEDPQGGPPVDVAFSKIPILLPAGTGWTSVEFPINPNALQASAGTVDAALMNATALRIYNSTAATEPGEAIVASLGVDNIQAVPETSPIPGLLVLTLLSVGGPVSWKQLFRSWVT